MRKVYIAAVLVFCASLASGQGFRIPGQVLTSGGFPNPSIRVCTEPATGTPCSPLANIFADKALSSPLPNPFPGDLQGNFAFYAGSGRYHVQVSGSGISTFDIPDVVTQSLGVSGVYQTVTFTATPTFDASTATFFTMTLTGNVTSSTLSNGQQGQVATLQICQDNSGSRTFAFPGNVILPSGFAIASAANACTYATFSYDGTNWRPFSFSGGNVAFGAASFTGQITSTVSTGTPPLVVASTTNIPNLNASTLNGATFSSPGPIGNISANTGAFTTLTANSATITSLDASTLGGKTFAIPAAIGSTTPNTGAFTTLSTTGDSTLGGLTLSASNYVDIPVIAAPANPAASKIRIFGDSGSGNFGCKTSAGASCISATAAPPLTGTVNPAATGTLVRAGSADTLKIRNNANGADLNLLSKNASDIVSLGDTAGVSLPGPLAVPVGSAGAPSIGFTGDTTTGIFRSGAGKIDFALAAAAGPEVTSSGINVGSAKLITGDNIASSNNCLQQQTIGGTPYLSLLGGGCAVTGTGKLDIGILKVNTGVNPTGTGMQHQRFGATCTTAAAAGATCNSTLTWTTGFADANYTPVCTLGTTASGIPAITALSQAAGTLTLTITAVTAVAAQSNAVDCIAMHD